MAYKQLTSVKSEVVAPAGLCLWFTQEKMSVPHLYPTAHDARVATQIRHYDRAFPTDVAVPVWFKWVGKLPGDDSAVEYDHAAVMINGQIVESSPLYGVGKAVFSSVDQLAQAFGNGMEFLYWTEDISEVKIMEVINMNSDEVKAGEATIRLAFNIGLLRQPRDDEIAHYLKVGYNTEQLMRAILTSKEHQDVSNMVDAAKNDKYKTRYEAAKKALEA